jgi:hypothetical protein
MIVDMISPIEMARVAAGRIATVVQGIWFAFWRRAMSEKTGKMVCFDFLSAGFAVRQSKPSITAWYMHAIPGPTLFPMPFVNFFVKTKKVASCQSKHIGKLAKKASVVKG